MADCKRVSFIASLLDHVAPHTHAHIPFVLTDWQRIFSVVVELDITNELSFLARPCYKYRFFLCPFSTHCNCFAFGLTIKNSLAARTRLIWILVCLFSLLLHILLEFVLLHAILQ